MSRSVRDNLPTCKRFGCDMQARPTDISSRGYVDLYNAVCAAESRTGSTVKLME